MEKDLLLFLTKEGGYNFNQNKFFLVDFDKLAEKIRNRKYDIDPRDDYNIINLNDISRDESLIQQFLPHKKKLDNFKLVVFYQCNGTKCEIEEKDKLKMDSYFLHFCYRGFSLEHQNPEKPIYPNDYYYCENLNFFENTNIIEIEWKLIEYEEKKRYLL
jgi:hypothetical protein